MKFVERVLKRGSSKNCYSSKLRNFRALDVRIQHVRNDIQGRFYSQRRSLRLGRKNNGDRGGYILYVLSVRNIYVHLRFLDLQDITKKPY